MVRESWGTDSSSSNLRILNSSLPLKNHWLTNSIHVLLCFGFSFQRSTQSKRLSVCVPVTMRSVTSCVRVPTSQFDVSLNLRCRRIYWLVYTGDDSRDWKLICALSHIILTPRVSTSTLPDVKAAIHTIGLLCFVLPWTFHLRHSLSFLFLFILFTAHRTESPLTLLLSHQSRNPTFTHFFQNYPLHSIPFSTMKYNSQSSTCSARR
jgi:hypothetical protein